MVEPGGRRARSLCLVVDAVWWPLKAFLKSVVIMTCLSIPLYGACNNCASPEELVEESKEGKKEIKKAIGVGR